MFYRHLPVLMFIGLVLLIIGCSTASVTAIQVAPSTATATVGQTMQFTATATYTKEHTRARIRMQPTRQPGPPAIRASQQSTLPVWQQLSRQVPPSLHGKHERLSWPCVQHG